MFYIINDKFIDMQGMQVQTLEWIIDWVEIGYGHLLNAMTIDEAIIMNEQLSSLIKITSTGYHLHPERIFTTTAYEHKPWR